MSRFKKKEKKGGGGEGQFSFSTEDCLKKMCLKDASADNWTTGYECPENKQSKAHVLMRQIIINSMAFSAIKV